MELDEFVTSTLKNILNGVKEAQKLDEHNNINPTGVNYDLSPVEFNVAVVTEDKTNADGKAKISVLGAHIGGGVENENLSKIATRIKFSVPITYPTKGVLNDR